MRQSTKGCNGVENKIFLQFGEAPPGTHFVTSLHTIESKYTRQGNIQVKHQVAESKGALSLCVYVEISHVNARSTFYATRLHLTLSV